MLKNYLVTKEGKVFSRTGWRGIKERELQHTLNYDGYPSVRLVINGKRKRISVHSLVGKYHVKGYKKGYQIRHLDGNKLNCHADNLCWGTAKENADDREKHGKTSKGEQHSKYIKAALAK